MSEEITKQAFKAKPEGESDDALPSATPDDTQKNSSSTVKSQGDKNNSVVNSPVADKTIPLPADAPSSSDKSTKRPLSPVDKTIVLPDNPPPVDKTVVLPEDASNEEKKSSGSSATKSTAIRDTGSKVTRASETVRMNKKGSRRDDDDTPSESRRNIKTVLGDTFDIIASTFGKGDAEKTNFYTTIKNEHNDQAYKELLNTRDQSMSDLGAIDKQYTFFEKIAEGGQGAVQKAVDKLFHRIVAVKSLHDNIKDKDEVRTSFIDEAEITAQLDHPSIVPVYGLYSDEKHGLHLAMKLINGQTLRKYLDTLTEQYENHIRANVAMRERKMLRQRLEVFLKICDAMSYAHSKHVIHRDLKPENIMIGRFNETYIMDWGIAQKLENQTSITPANISGTPRYIPPELLNKQPIDRRSDIYLLGLILFEIVFLKKAYPQRHAEDALRAAKEGEIAPLKHAFGVTIDRDLKAIVAAALAPNPEDRYSSVARMADDIRNYLNDEAVSVSPYPRLAATMRLIRRHSKFFFFLLLILGTFLFAGSTAAVLREVYKQLESDKIESALGQVFTESVHTAYTIDTQFKNIGAHMQLFSEEVSFRMKNPSPSLPVSDFYNYIAGRTPQTAPPGFQYHPNYSTYVSFKTFVYKQVPVKEPENLQLILNAVNSMLPTFECYMMMHGKQNINHDFPILSLYMGFESGVHISYPYNTDYADNYDPRLRTWYTSAQMSKSGMPIWTKPYLNKNQVKQLVMTCSIPLKNASDELIGVMGADVLPETLQEILHANTTNQPYILAKYIVSKDGEICSDVSGHYSPTINNKQIAFYSFPDMELFKKMWVMKNGRFFANKAQTSVYTFVHLQSIDMLYVEKLNFMKLKENL
ncbi:MAG: protein kinase [Victivallales bacterium]|nr:protein kinase [Victivallales bacterium]